MAANTAIIEVEIAEPVLRETVTPDSPPIKMHYRPIVCIHVEGYNWISPKICYYKSTSLSNARTSTPDETLIRKYMWFPTIGVLQPNTLIKKMFECADKDKPNGFIVKYIREIFNKMPKGRNIIGPCMINYLFSPNFKVYSEYLKLCPYTVFLHGPKYDRTKTKERYDEIQSFIDFIALMCIYCYNWRQIQDSIRLSIDNEVDGVSLLDSKFGNICSFILHYDLIDECGSPHFVKRSSPLEKIVTSRLILMRHPDGDKPTEETVMLDDPEQINRYLLGQEAINYDLMIQRLQEPVETHEASPSASAPASASASASASDLHETPWGPREISRRYAHEIELFKPFFETLYYGKPFGIHGKKGGRRSRKNKKIQKRKQSRRKNASRKKYKSMKNNVFKK
jgi:hypothetical protein